MDGIEVHLAEGLAFYLGTCHHNALGDDGRVVLVPVHLDAVAEESENGFGVIFSANNSDFVAHVEGRVVVGLRDDAIVLNAGAYEGAAQKTAYFKECLAFERLVAGHNGHMVRPGVGILLGLALDFFRFLMQRDTHEVA